MKRLMIVIAALAAASAAFADVEIVHLSSRDQAYAIVMGLTTADDFRACEAEGWPASDHCVSTARAVAMTISRHWRGKGYGR